MIYMKSFGLVVHKIYSGIFKLQWPSNFRHNFNKEE
jgi:hypothetical protein